MLKIYSIRPALSATDFLFSPFARRLADSSVVVAVFKTSICNTPDHSTKLITEQHYAQIHPDYREKAREYAKRTYASNVTL